MRDACRYTKGNCPSPGCGDHDTNPTPPLTYSDVEWSGKCPTPTPCGKIASAQWCCEAHALEDEQARQNLESIAEYRAAEIRRQDVLLGHGCASAERAALPLRILCDVDGVLADFVGLVLDYAEHTYGMRYSHDAVDQWDCFAALNMPEAWPHFRVWCDTLSKCRSMRAFPLASHFYAELRRIVGESGDGGAVRVCTSPMTPAWLTQRAEWLIEFGVPLGEQYHIHDKHHLTRSACGTGGFDVLIDDRAENCNAFVSAGGRAFCIATPYNATGLDRGIARGTHGECLAWLREFAAERAAFANRESPT